MSIQFILRLTGMIAFGALGIYGGVELANLSGEDVQTFARIFGLVGALVGLVLTPYITVYPLRAARRVLAQVSSRALLAGLFGLIISLVIAGLLAFPLSLLPRPFSQILPIVFAILISYFGVTVFISRQNDILSFVNLPNRSGSPEGRTRSASESGTSILMDTSVIIDGRIVDIARTGFVPGALIIPRFVLNELQHIADSGDKLRRQRGRRGLEVVATLQKDAKLGVRISDVDVEGTRNVDDKLVILARQMHAPVLTNDFNLNRVAELQGVTILNINELANAVKAVFLPGEELAVKVIQTGREPRQGIGYLEDGTMVVIQDGSDHLGTTVNASVTKVLQTAAGRMVFAKPETAARVNRRNNKPARN